MAERKRIPSDVEARVLLQSKRRCCLCFHLDQDYSEKIGQLAHLDQAASNAAEDNLVFLCLDHHSLYDSTTRQHKGYTLREVRAARDELYARLQDRPDNPRDSDLAVARKKSGSAHARRSLQVRRSDSSATRRQGWIRKNNTEGVIVFVPDQFVSAEAHSTTDLNNSLMSWPNIIGLDRRFIGASVFWADSYLDNTGRLLDPNECAIHLLSLLEGTQNAPGPISFQRILFICHGTGGVVTKSLLAGNPTWFGRHRIGLLLFSSPPQWSRTAQRVGGLKRYLEHHSEGAILNWSENDLESIERAFENLLNSALIPGIVGREAIGDAGPTLKSRWLPSTDAKNEDHGCFGKMDVLADVDWLSIFLPDSPGHQSHRILQRFWEQHFSENHLFHRVTTPPNRVAGYYWYISSAKLSWLAPSDAGGRLEHIDMAEIVPFGRPDVYHFHASEKQDAAVRLHRCLTRIREQIISLECTAELTTNGVYSWRGVFAVKEFDSPHSVIRLVARVGDQTLTLDCSAQHFSDYKDGALEIHSLNYGFFVRKEPLTLSAVFVLLSKDSIDGIFASPLCIKRELAIIGHS